MIYLLDLNQTLVDAKKDAPRIRPFELQIANEIYRQWLVDMLRNRYVILITARPKKYRTMTLERIQSLTNWQPQEAYFSEIRSWPHFKKAHLLRKYVLPKHGKDGRQYFGIDSADCIDDLRNPPSNHLEKLKGDRKDEWSVKINDQWRVCFKFDENKGETFDVGIEDYH